MPFLSRKFGVAMLVASTVFTLVTASAASLNLTGTGAGLVGAGEITVSSPCTSMVVSYTFHFVAPQYELNHIVLTGTGCSGTGLTVRVQISAGLSTPAEHTDLGVDSADLNAGYDMDVSGLGVPAAAFVGLAVLITG